MLLAVAGSLPWLPAADNASAPGLTATLKGHSEAIYAVAFTPDGKYVVSGSGDRTIKVWDSATGKDLKSYGGSSGHQNLVLSVSIRADGSLIASGGADNKAMLWDFPSSSPLRNIAKSEGVRTLAVTPDGTKVAGGDKDGHVKIWNGADGKELFKLDGHSGSVTGVAFSNNGQLLVSCGSDKTLRFWNPGNGQAIAVTGAMPARLPASFPSEQQRRVWRRHGRQPEVLGCPAGRLETAGHSARRCRHGPVPVRRQQFARLRQRRQECASDECVEWPTDPRFQGGERSGGIRGFIAQRRDDRGSTADKQLLLWQTKDGQLLANVADKAASVAFHPASTQLLTGGSDGLLKLWAMPPVPERTLTHPDAVYAAVASADGKRLFTGGADKMVRAWNLSNLKQPERQFSGHTAAVNAVAMSASGQVLASAGDDETIRFWNQANGQQTAFIGASAAR